MAKDKTPTVELVNDMRQTAFVLHCGKYAQDGPLDKQSKMVMLRDIVWKQR